MMVILSRPTLSSPTLSPPITSPMAGKIGAWTDGATLVEPAPSGWSATSTPFARRMALTPHDLRAGIRDAAGDLGRGVGRAGERKTHQVGRQRAAVRSEQCLLLVDFILVQHGCPPFTVSPCAVVPPSVTVAAADDPSGHLYLAMFALRTLRCNVMQSIGRHRVTVSPCHLVILSPASPPHIPRPLGDLELPG